MRSFLSITAPLILTMLGALACGGSATSTPIPTSPPQSSYPDYYSSNPMIHQVGKSIVSTDGNPIRLKGVNLGGWLLWEGWEYGKGLNVAETTIYSRLETLVGTAQAAEFRNQVYADYITADDIARIAELGFNSVRVPINAKILEDEAHPYVYLDSGWSILDRLLAWCESNHVYVILDLHAAPGGQSRLSPSDPGPRDELLWRNAENQRRTVALWKAIAARYADRQIVAGYDLINEPLPPRGQDLAKLESQIVEAIRSVDRFHMVIVEGGKFSSDFSMFTTPISGNQAYGFHMYSWFGDNRRKSLDSLRALSDAQRVPLWAGEFGENTYDMIATTVAMYEDPSNEIDGGWSFWTWKKVPGRFPALIAIDEPASWKAVIDWIGDPKHNPQPTQEQAMTGMRDFLVAIRLENDRLDTSMYLALMGSSPQR